MKLAILGAVIAATVISALPASAQVVIRAGENGVVVRERSDNGRHRGWEHSRGHRSHAECRTIRTRIVTPSGRVIFKTRRTC